MDQILVEVNDPSQVTYLPPELLNYINQGNRMMRRSIYEIRPRLLMEPPLTGTTSGSTITFPKNIMRIIDFRCNHRQIFEVTTDEHRHDEFDDDDEFNGDGKEGYGFILMGFNQVKITPHSVHPHQYEIQWIAGLDENLSATDDLGLPLELEDVIVEYATMRAGMRNGADVSGETSMVSLFKQQIEENISNLGGPRHSICKGYRSYGSRRNRYW
jgi:hypothetical protein